MEAVDGNMEYGALMRMLPGTINRRGVFYVKCEQVNFQFVPYTVPLLLSTFFEPSFDVLPVHNRNGLGD